MKIEEAYENLRKICCLNSKEKKINKISWICPGQVNKDVNICAHILWSFWRTSRFIYKLFLWRVLFYKWHRGIVWEIILFALMLTIFPIQFHVREFRNILKYFLSRQVILLNRNIYIFNQKMSEPALNPILK